MPSYTLIFNKLPDELLSEVLSYLKNDYQTLDSFCEAFRDDDRLYEAGLTQRWSKIAIRDIDLFLFIEVKESAGGSSSSRDHNAQSLLTEVRPGHHAAEYVRELLFDFRAMGYPGQRLHRNGQQQWFPKLGTPEIQHTLDLLNSHLTNLQTIRYDGNLPQGVLDTFTNLKNTKKLCNLVLQKRYGLPFHPNSFLRPKHDPEIRPCLVFRGLERLIHLTNFEYHNLAHYEASSFMVLLSKLPNLKKLVVADERYDWRGMPGDPHACGMRQFLEQILWNGSSAGVESQNPDAQAACRLPQTLKSLRLFDHHCWEQPQKSMTNEIVIHNGSLTDLDIDIDGLDYISRFVNSLPEARLKYFTAPGSTMPYQTPNHFQGLHDVIEIHQSTLERVKILQAWCCADDFAAEFNSRWQGKFSIQELVLGRQDHRWDYRPSTLTGYLNESRAGVSNEIPTPDKWGDQLRRIRIDLLKLSPDPEVDVLQLQRFQRLQILMLQPYDGVDVPESSSNVAHGSDPYQIDEHSALTIAQDITTHCSMLRVIVLQKHWYWISAKDTISDERRLWIWKEAKLDKHESARMARFLSQKDTDFLTSTDVKCINARFRQEEDDARIPSTLAGDALVEINHRWNYLSALPVED